MQPRTPTVHRILRESRFPPNAALSLSHQTHLLICKGALRSFPEKWPIVDL